MDDQNINTPPNTQNSLQRRQRFSNPFIFFIRAVAAILTFPIMSMLESLIFSSIGTVPIHNLFALSLLDSMVFIAPSIYIGAAILVFWLVGKCFYREPAPKTLEQAPYGENILNPKMERTKSAALGIPILSTLVFSIFCFAVLYGFKKDAVGVLIIFVPLIIALIITILLTRKKAQQQNNTALIGIPILSIIAALAFGFLLMYIISLTDSLGLAVLMLSPIVLALAIVVEIFIYNILMKRWK